ncbi:hypothetical protein L2E82_06678 [Cichorium intybus]|uniref:Uncharacterized protein n=1 Tax=Cichorium intybus TaxID=13427 RepID=A0ACB9HAP9_CICIN|nr:hypothetical protein L2E82_06678 [Cichorium intybus]
MVRNFPTRESSPQNPLQSVTFIIAFVAAVITIVSFLCGVPKKNHKRTSIPLTNREAFVHEETQPFEVRIEEKKDSHRSFDLPPPRETTIEPFPPPPDTTVKPLPLPPAMVNLRAASFHVRSNSNLSQKGKLSSSMSMRSIRGYKKASKKEAKRDKKKLTHEDSIWKKTIILGEKCRVPDDEDEAIVYLLEFMIE